MFTSKMLKTMSCINKCQMSQNSIRGYAKGKKKRFAVVLSGSGMLDGTEIHEAASAVIHLTKHNYEPIFYGVTCPQADVIDHSKVNSLLETRILRDPSLPLLLIC